MKPAFLASEACSPVQCFFWNLVALSLLKIYLQSFPNSVISSLRKCPDSEHHVSSTTPYALSNHLAVLLHSVLISLLLPMSTVFVTHWEEILLV